MNNKENILKSINDKQNAFDDLNKLITDYFNSDIEKENDLLKHELDELQRSLSDIKNKNEKLQIENNELKVALKEQIIDEKTNILKLSKKRIDTYFKRDSSIRNQLLELEFSLKEKINKLRALINRNFYKNKEEALKEVDIFSKRLRKNIQDQRLELEKDELSLKEKIDKGYSDLQSEDIDEEIIEKRRKQNRLELKIGLNLFNKLGIFLILIAIGVAAKYSYSTWFNSYAKGFLFYSIGIIMLSFGEFFFRKNHDVFSKGLIGGGLATLYSATFFSYFSLHIIDLRLGLIISLLITLISIILSLRYNSKVIASFALLGGYIPFLTYIYSFGLSENLVYIAMGYLLILNFFMLLISIKRSWKVTNYLSFFLNLPSMVYLVNLSENKIIGISYAVITFLMYLSITLSYPFKYKAKLKLPDIILLAINTLVSCIIIYKLFSETNIANYKGLLALIFALVYIGLGSLVNKIMEIERETIALFYGTALTFVVLMIPFQFGIDWLSMGWLVEGIILAIVGYRLKIKAMEYSGLGIFGISLGSFIIFDLLKISGSMSLFEFKFSIVIFAMIILLFNYLIDQNNGKITHYSNRGRKIQIYKIITVICFYFYTIYIADYIYGKLHIENRILYRYFNNILIASIHILLALSLPKIKLIRDKSIKIISNILNIIAILICIVLTISTPVISNIESNTVLNYLSFIILLIYNAYSILKIRDFTILLIDKNGLSIELYPIIFSTYIMGSAISIMIFQMNLGSINLAISFLILLFAIGNIIFGYIKKYSHIRLYGLALSLFSTGKLFLWDLRHLTLGYKIGAYFSFGIVLILISFIYQKINKEVYNDAQ